MGGDGDDANPATLHQATRSGLPSGQGGALRKIDSSTAAPAARPGGGKLEKTLQVIDFCGRVSLAS
ncbi:hypothetical protein GCM10009780_27890 [Actinomadura alba]